MDVGVDGGEGLSRDSSGSLHRIEKEFVFNFEICHALGGRFDGVVSPDDGLSLADDGKGFFMEDEEEGFFVMMKVVLEAGNEAIDVLFYVFSLL